MRTARQGRRNESPEPGGMGRATAGPASRDPAPSGDPAAVSLYRAPCEPSRRRRREREPPAARAAVRGGVPTSSDLHPPMAGWRLGPVGQSLRSPSWPRPSGQPGTPHDPYHHRRRWRVQRMAALRLTHPLPGNRRQRLVTLSPWSAMSRPWLSRSPSTRAGHEPDDHRQYERGDDARDTARGKRRAGVEAEPAGPETPGRRCLACGFALGFVDNGVGAG